MENKKNMTAVEWLIERLEINNSVSRQGEFWNLLKNQAKQMEEDKIREAYYRGVKDEMQNVGKDFEDFYNETYNKKDHA